MTEWRIVIPVRKLGAGKTRTGLDSSDRRDLSLAMLRDVMAAVKATRGVGERVICTSDTSLLDALPRDNFWLTTGSEGLNTDLEEALTDISDPRRGAPTAVVVADLPCLTPSDLQAVLVEAERGSAAFVASVDGGTTVLANSDSRRLSPSFGESSAVKHRRWNKDVSSAVGVGCRLDVDTLEALAWGQRIGLGPSTESWVTSKGGIAALLGISDPERSMRKVSIA